MCWVMFHQAHMLVICSEEELFVADALSSAEGKEEGRGGLASPVPWNILRTSPGVETKLRTVSPRSASLPPCWCRDAALFGGSLSASTIVLQVVIILMWVRLYNIVPNRTCFSNLWASFYRKVEERFHMCDRVAIYFFIAASYSPWWVMCFSLFYKNKITQVLIQLGHRTALGLPM
ncbi:hypothetical protein XENOCAPTIV_028771 [Xenoophorus captivus]|uniref:Uncharacterized protein n=1 Tax=Xenoophorus captivus TaxID=1517983 RepID=A0ABV0RP16_9TELE